MIVVDASLAVHWIADEANSEAALMLLERNDLAAPDLLVVEVGNAFRRKRAGGELTDRQIANGFELVFARVQLFPPTRELMTRAFQISLELGHSLYDCVYVALTESLGGQFVSHDLELLKRIRRGGYEALIGELPLE